MKARQIGLGCLALPVIGILFALGVAATAFFMGPVDRAPTTRAKQQDIPWARSADSTTTRTGGDASDVGQVLDVVLEFEEGEFEIVPGLPGSGISYEAEFDQGAYRLEPTWVDDAGGGDRFQLRFERSASLVGLRQLVHREESVQDNFVRVSLPTNVPMRLHVQMRKGEAQFDFSGLSLVSLVLDSKMGSTQVNMDRDNPVDMEFCDIKAEMGEMRFYGMGFAAPRAIRFRGRMGGFLLDLEGPGTTQVDASFELLMGELRVEVPRKLAVSVNEQHALFGEIESRGSSLPAAENDTQRRMNVEARVRLGNIILD